jgi:hypothetical protein
LFDFLFISEASNNSIVTIDGEEGNNNWRNEFTSTTETAPHPDVTW